MTTKTIKLDKDVFAIRKHSRPVNIMRHHGRTINRALYVDDAGLLWCKMEGAWVGVDPVAYGTGYIVNDFYRVACEVINF